MCFVVKEFNGADSVPKTALLSFLQQEYEVRESSSLLCKPMLFNYRGYNFLQGLQLHFLRGATETMGALEAICGFWCFVFWRSRSGVGGV